MLKIIERRDLGTPYRYYRYCVDGVPAYTDKIAFAARLSDSNAKMVHTHLKILRPQEGLSIRDIKETNVIFNGGDEGEDV
jgi:hypothetical protein